MISPRHAVRAVLFDENGLLILIRREHQARDPYWVTPGGGIESADSGNREALKRELWEELGATATIGSLIANLPNPEQGDTAFYLADLISMNLSERTGREFSDPAGGKYDIEHVSVEDAIAPEFNLVPNELKAVIRELAASKRRRRS